MKTLEKTIVSHVGSKIRAARKASGQSQTEVANHLGLTFQQLQKYENGTNRISAGRMFILAQYFGKPLHWFFEGLQPVSDENDLRAQTKAMVDQATEGKVKAVHTLLSV